MDEDTKQELADTSDEMLSTLQRLKATERRKRGLPISTPAFHELADEVDRLSDRVFELAHEQDRLGEASTRGETTINDLSPKNDAEGSA